MSDPVAFTADVVDGVDDVLASHVNNLRAWARESSFIPANTHTHTMTGTLTLVDADLVVQFLDMDGAARDVILPAEASTNHAFAIFNTSAAAYSATVKDDAANTIATVAQGEGRLIVSNGVIWRALT